MIARKLYFWFSPVMRRVVRRFWFMPGDLFERISGKRKALVPPRGLIYTGAGDFAAIGDGFLEYFIRYCSLCPDGHVLDVGSGIGRIARPLTRYLNKTGSYHGFDVVNQGVQWCQANYSKFANFHFQYVPLHNDLYNQETKERSSHFRFPYQDQVFDLVVLISVFTHMQEEDVKHYLQEIDRVLKPGQYCFATFFIVTEQSELYLQNSKAPFFPYRFGNYYLHDTKVKDANVAFRMDWLQSVLALSRLKITSFFPGWWAGSKEGSLDYQDVVIFTKAA